MFYPLRSSRIQYASISRTVVAGWILVLFSGVGFKLCGQSVVAITNVTVIDATGAQPKPHTTVVIASGRITEITDDVAFQTPASAAMIDGTGKFLIPGLWDMHVHWYDTDYLPIFIANGITGMRIMWGFPLHHEWRKKIEDGSLLGPRLLIASTIVDGPDPVWPGSLVASNADEGRQAVKQSIAEGADFIKVYSRLPRAAYFAIADEAKKRGIPFEGHVPDSVTVEEASDAGQLTMEHLLGLPAACDTPAKAKAVFAKFKTNHTWQCPTLTVLRIMDCMGNPAGTNDDRLRFMPAELRDYWLDRMTAFDSKPPAEKTDRQKTYRRDLELVAEMQRAGVDILAGTDTGNPFCFPGFSLHDELGLLVQAGLSPMQALQTATLNPARFLGQEKDLGTIEKGKFADLILLDANPLEDIGNTRKIDAVIYRGRAYPRPALDEMLATIQSLAGATKSGIGEALSRTLAAQGVDAAIARYRQLKSSQPSAYDFSEEQLNLLGYSLIQKKKFTDAIKILELNVEQFPNSANVYDSLGEACLDDGQNDLAAKNYQRSLELNPANSTALHVLKRLSAAISTSTNMSKPSPP